MRLLLAPNGVDGPKNCKPYTSDPYRSEHFLPRILKSHLRGLDFAMDSAHCSRIDAKLLNPGVGPVSDPIRSSLSGSTRAQEEVIMKSSRVGSSMNPWSIYLVSVLTLLLVALDSAHAVEPTSGISFAQVSFTSASQPYSHYGKAFINYGMLYGSGYLNVERYENERAVGWVVKNLPVVNGDVQSGAGTMFDLGVSGYQSSFTAYVEFSPTPLPDDSSLRGQLPLTYLLAQISLPADDNPNQFEDVVCHKDDKKFWTGQQSVLYVLVALGGTNTANGTGWLIKGKDPNKILMITASHNFTDAQAEKTGVTVNLQKTECGGTKREKYWFGDVDEVLERNKNLDFVIVRLKQAPRGKTYPPPLQALYKDIKLNHLVTIPQHPAEVTIFKQAGYYYDIENKKRCNIGPTAAINDLRGEVDAKCGAVHGTSGSPLLDATETKGDDTPYAIGLITGCRLKPDRTCKPLAAAGYKMSNICDYDAGAEGKKLLDCKKP